MELQATLAAIFPLLLLESLFLGPPFCVTVCKDEMPITISRSLQSATDSNDGVSYRAIGKRGVRRNLLLAGHHIVTSLHCAFWKGKGQRMDGETQVKTFARHPFYRVARSPVAPNCKRGGYDEKDEQVKATKRKGKLASPVAAA